MPLDPTARTYDRKTILLHWLTAFLVTALWALGQTIDWFPRGAPRTGARSVHIVVGCALLAVLVVRILWRSTRGRHLPSTDPAWMTALAHATHSGLYMLLSTTVVLGVVNALVRGDRIFGLFAIPSIAPGNDALRGLIEEWHGLAANVLLALAAFHASAALFHYFGRRDGVLGRMVPPLSR